MNGIPYMLGVAGPSCSGKTSLARLLAQRLPATIIALDSYYRDLSHLEFDARTRINFDEPESLDWDLMVPQLSRLARGEAIDRPVYDFAAHTRLRRTERVSPEPLVIVEGLFTLLRADLRALFDRKVFIAVQDETCLARRLSRDVAERGRTPESVIEQYTRTVRPMAQKYVLPTQAFADLVVSGDGRTEDLCSAVFTYLMRDPSGYRRLAANA